VAKFFAQARAPEKATSSPYTIPGFLLLAFLGGLLLNLMPCVLPILSLKVLGFSGAASSDRGLSRQRGLLYSAGVVFSFWILAGALLLLRLGGQGVGWGFWLQSPGLVLGLSVLFFLLALNLFGVFEMGISLAAWAGSGLGRFSGMVGDFLGGVLAVVVATPCTAPFMGTALGFAVTQPVPISLGIFTALGLGMALPYLLLTFYPRLIWFLPKPGPWMEILKHALGFPLMGAVVWLLWVFGRQSGVDALSVALVALLGVGVGAWIWGRWGTLGRSLRSRVLSGLAAGFFIVGGPWVAALRTVSGPSQLLWEPFSEERVAQVQKTGRRVFVDFTAAWCLTCQVNERTTLQSPSVVDRFRKLNVATLKADWTSRDPLITEALARHGRVGVPLYLLYGRDPSRPPKVFPALLTSDIVLNALDEDK
jgi:thiol:disulfide interchange protein DsbD